MGDPFAVGKSQLHTRVSEAVKEVRQLRRRHERTGDPYDKELYKAARNRKTRLIKIALRRYHRRKVQEVIEGPGGMWRMSKWARNRQGAYDQGSRRQSRYQGTSRDSRRESSCFPASFLPSTATADLSDIDSKVINHDPTEINRGPIRFPEITHQEIKQAVKASPPDKAPGEDGLPNSLWHKLIEIRQYSTPSLEFTTRAYGLKSITVVLRKAGKRDYQLAKSYRPVALLNTLGKFLEAVVADELATQWKHTNCFRIPISAEEGNLSRPCYPVDHRPIRRAWGKGKIASMLLLDVSEHLVEGCEGVKTSGWVDDVAFIVIGKDEHETISKLQKACQYADAWAARHASGTTVQATTTAERYLGVWLDPGLTFQHHRQQMLAKAGVSLQALRGLTGSTWGASLSAMRAIYQAVMIPQMLFGAAAWHSPLTSTLRERSYVKQFANIQSRAACLMSGAFKTTAREALDIELHLLPMQQQLDRLVQLAAIRGVYTDGGPNLEEGWLPHYTLGAIGEYLGEQEGIHPGTMDQAPRVYIEERERAINTHKRTTEQLYAPARLYTDGSGYQGGIGAAVYPAYPYRRNEARLCNMGTDDDATVYAAELRAIEMALEVIKERFNDDNEWRDCLAKSGVVIFTDNQATLRAIQNPRMPSGQVYLEGCLRLLEWCNDKIQVELRWVPAHEGIPGNEAADMYAKEAATTTETNIHDTNANANTNANTNDNTNVNTNVNHNRSIRLAAAASKKDSEEDEEDDRGAKQVKFDLLEGPAESDNISFDPTPHSADRGEVHDRIGTLGTVSVSGLVAMGKEQGEEDSKPKPTQDTANVGETGNTSQWPGARSAEVTSHQRTWRTTHAADEDEEAWRHDPNLFVFDLPE
ncbi:hypothetical protein PDIDSM_5649 [Penicillium digitatum]|nr:hypothetical protein PDIDSM_5649 [Penicillium digitatum]